MVKKGHLSSPESERKLHIVTICVGSPPYFVSESREYPRKKRRNEVARGIGN